MSQKFTITAKNVTVSKAYEIVDGKEICNISASVSAKGTYDSAMTVSGDFKMGAGLAFTIVNKIANQSVKVICTFSTSGSLTSMPSGFPTTATLYVYNSETNQLIDSGTLSGTELGGVVYFVMNS